MGSKVAVLILPIVLLASCVLPEAVEQRISDIDAGIAKIEAGLQQPNLSEEDREWLEGQLAVLQEAREVTEEAGKASVAYGVGADALGFVETLLYLLGGGGATAVPFVVALRKAARARQEAELKAALAEAKIPTGGAPVT